MGKERKLFGYFAKKYRLLNAKKYTTIAGTLVFFLLMSLVPMVFWGSLIFGKLHVSAPTSLSFPGFEEVGSLLDYIRQEAQNATSGASVFLLLTSLYSATNLFYQMRKSGEIIYEVPYTGQGVRARLGAVGVLFLILAVIVLTVFAFAMLSLLMVRVFGFHFETLMQYLLLATIGFLLAFMLNLYICPYKASPKCFLLGALFTVAAWAVAIFGFAVYLRFSNMRRLYGALSAVIVFLLWLYVLTLCFVAGVIFNSERVMAARCKNFENLRKNMI